LAGVEGNNFVLARVEGLRRVLADFPLQRLRGSKIFKNYLFSSSLKGGVGRSWEEQFCPCQGRGLEEGLGRFSPAKAAWK
jgi:hypothetical protein